MAPKTHWILILCLGDEINLLDGLALHFCHQGRVRDGQAQLLPAKDDQVGLLGCGLVQLNHPSLEIRVLTSFGSEDALLLFQFGQSNLEFGLVP